MDAKSPIEQFLVELAELSRKHGIWVHGTPEHQPQLMQQGYGDETGYEPLLRFRGQRPADLHFRLLGESIEWIQGDPATRGEAPKPIQKLFDAMHQRREPA